MRINLLVKFLIILLFLFIISIVIIGQQILPVRAVAYNSETGIVAIGIADIVEIRNFNTNQLIATIDSPFDGSATVINENFHVNELVFNPTGSKLAISYSGSESPGYILVVDTSTGQTLHSFSEGSGVFAIAWNSNGNQIAAKVMFGSLGTTLVRLIVWDLNTETQIVNEDIAINIPLIGLAWRWDGSQVATSSGNFAEIWDTSTWTKMPIVFQGNRDLQELAWSSDSSKLIGLDTFGTFYVWDSSTGNELYKLQMDLPQGIYNFVISSDDTIAINTGVNILVWNILEPTTQIIPVISPINDIAWFNDTELVYGDSIGLGIFNISAISNFSLLGSNNNPITGFDPLTSGAEVPTSVGTVNIRANTNPETVGSVVFDLNGVVQTDDSAPYEFSNWQPSVGQYTLTATPYSGSGGTGTAGTPLSISFTVIQEISCDVTVPASNNAALISAIQTANTAGSPQTLCLEGQYLFTQSHNSAADGANALPVITGDIHLHGLGTGTSLVREVNAPQFRLLKVNTGADLVLSNLRIAQGSVDNSQTGGGIRNLGNLEVLNATFQNNTAGNGGAIRNNNNAILNVTNSSFQGNIALSSGGAIYTNTGSQTSISNSQFLNNQASAASTGGGAILMNGASLSISNSHFEGNTGRNGAALMILQVSGANPAQLTGLSFLNNAANNHGGAFYLNAGTVTMDDISFVGNTASSHGGAVRNLGNLTISNSSFSNNYAQSAGGGALSNNGTMTVENSQMDGNWVSSASALGGALFNESNLSLNNVQITAGTVTDYHARYGGALYSSVGQTSISATSISGQRALLRGGAIRIEGTALLQATGLSLSNNQADYGGAISSSGTLQFDYGSLENNQATTRGGAVDINNVTNSYLRFSCLAGNTAPSGNAIFSEVNPFDASNNWWGIVSGPSGSDVNANVVVQPILSEDCNTSGQSSAMASQSLMLATSSENSLPSQALPYQTDFESLSAWQITGTWTLEAFAGRTGRAWLLDASLPQQESIVTMPMLINLGNRANPQLRFWHHGLLYDGQVQLELRLANSQTWQVLAELSNVSLEWTQVQVDLSAYRGQSIQLRWRYSSQDEEVLEQANLFYAFDDIDLSYSR